MPDNGHQGIHAIDTMRSGVQLHAQHSFLDLLDSNLDGRWLPVLVCLGIKLWDNSFSSNQLRPQTPDEVCVYKLVILFKVPPIPNVFNVGSCLWDNSFSDSHENVTANVCELKIYIIGVYIRVRSGREL
jgi:hypothetical protein